MGFLEDLVFGSIKGALQDRGLKALGLKPSYKDITFEQAVKMVLDDVFRLSQLSPEAIYEDLKPTYGEAVAYRSPEAKQKASLDLALALISYEMIIVRELFRKESEEYIPKIHKCFWKLIEEGENGKYKKTELEAYLSLYEDYVNRDLAYKDMPFLSPDFEVQLKRVAERLIKKLYGNKIEDKKLVGSEQLTLVEFFKCFFLESGGRWLIVLKDCAFSDG